MIRRLLIFAIVAFLSPVARSSDSQEAKSSADALVRINDRYKKTVKPIFEQKCFDCHSRFTHRPWYFRLPVAKQLIEHDVREARADVDMSDDFPFLGKGTPTDYLDVLEDAVNDGSMPPWRYRIMHKDSKLTDAERKTILDWIGYGRGQLKTKGD